MNGALAGLLAVIVLGVAGFTAFVAKNDPAPIRSTTAVLDAGVAPASSAFGERLATGTVAAPVATAAEAPSLDKPIPPIPSALPASPPRRVGFGTIHVTFAGTDDAPTNARSRAAAEELILRLGHLAQSDWKSALAQGDSDSADDYGHVDLGDLQDKVSERALFSLEPGGVSGIVLTRTGYWIYRRRE